MTHRWIVEEADENGGTKFSIYKHDHIDQPREDWEFYDSYRTKDEAIKGCGVCDWDEYK